MNRHTFARTFAQSIIVAGMALSATALAGSDILKCIDDAGRLTLTDMPCPKGEQPLAVRATGSEPAAAGEARPAPQGIVVERVVRVEMATQQVVPVKRYGAAVGLSGDVATLKTARLNMLLLDKADQAIRAQRVAGLQ